MYKQIFKKENGQPELIESVTDEDTGESYFDYDESIYTDIMPENGLYQPIYFRDGKWYGSTKEDWEAAQPPKEDAPKDIGTFLLAQTQIQLAEVASALSDREKDVEALKTQNAEILLKLTELEGGQ